MMTTLVVGPFFLGGGLRLSAAMVGAVMTVGPVISILAGVPSGRLVDRLGAPTVLVVGLVLLAAGAAGMALLPPVLGVAGYVLAVIVLTPGYQLFQAANNTTTLADVPPALRGTVSGLLGLSRNLGLIAGASAMGAVFAAGVGQAEISHAAPAALAEGLRVTFALAAGLMALALAINAAGRRR
jgi:MFS family permease